MVLSDFHGGLEQLAAELMGRIAHEGPVLPVPLVATVLLTADGPVPRDTLKARAHALIAGLGDSRTEFPQDTYDAALEDGLQVLELRGLVQDGCDGIQVTKGQESVPSFYAASIKHLFRDCSK